MFGKLKKSCVVASVLVTIAGWGHANDVLIEKLYEKGVINDLDYQEIQAQKSRLDASNALIEKLYEKGVINDLDYQEIQADKGKTVVQAKKTDANALEGKWKDGFKWEGQNQKNKFQVAGRIQQDFYDYDHDLEEDTFSTRRVYLGVKATIDEIWGLQTTFNPDSNELEYGYLDFKPSEKFIARFGAQKFYAGFEESTSSRFTDFLERSVADGLQPGKQVGIQLFGEPIKKTFFYSFGYYNGEGKNTDESGERGDGKDSMFAAAYNAASMMSTNNDAIFHFGVASSSGTRNRPDDNEIFSLDGEARGDEFGIWTLAAGPTEFSRDYANISFVAAKGPFKFHTERTIVEVETPVQDDEVQASFMAMTWMLTGEPYVDSYSIKGMKGIQPARPYTKAGGIGAWEIGIRRSEWDAQSVDDLNYTGADLVKTTTLGLTWIPNKKVRFKLNVVTTNYNTPIVAAEGDEEAITFRSQIDF